MKGFSEEHSDKNCIHGRIIGSMCKIICTTNLKIYLFSMKKKLQIFQIS